PSIVGRPSTGSMRPGCVTGPTTGTILDQLMPPSVERDISSNTCWPSEETVPIPKTYAVPVLSLRTVQPSAGLTWLLFAAPVSCCCLHVEPPSCETAMVSGAGPAPLLRKSAQQT